MTMDGRAKTIKPLLDQVVLEFVGVPQVKVTPAVEEGGEPVEQTFIVTRAIVREMGPYLLEDDEDPGFKIGDWVVFDGANVMAIDIEDPKEEGKILRYGICGRNQVLGIYIEA
jgi:hypothetical protein